MDRIFNKAHTPVLDVSVSHDHIKSLKYVFPNSATAHSYLSSNNCILAKQLKLSYCNTLGSKLLLNLVVCQ